MDDDRATGDTDTLPSARAAGCLHCAARAHVDARAVRAHVTRMTIVTDYERAKVGRGVVERSKAMASFPDGEIHRGEGASREDAMEAALESRAAARP